MFVARPLAVFTSLTPFRVPWRQQAMISWVGLRGAVPIVLATWPRIAGAPGADRVFDIVFFVVFTSVLLQGSSLPLVARWLDVIAPPAPPDPAPIGEVHGAHRLTVIPGATVIGRPLLDLRLPRGALIYLIERGGRVFVPQGQTRLERDDVLHLVLDHHEVAAVRAILGA